MAKSPFPSKQQIVDFVRDTPGRVGKREIARAFKLDVDQKRLLKSVLKENEVRGHARRGGVGNKFLIPNTPQRLYHRIFRGGS